MNNNRILAMIDDGFTLAEIVKITGRPRSTVSAVQGCNSIQADMVNAQRLAIWRRQHEGAKLTRRLNRSET